MGRVRRAVAKANQRLTVQFAAALLSGATLLSSLLGLWRERLINRYYLEPYPAGADAYTVAFVVPDFMFFILVSGALSVTFIPVFNQRMAKGNKRSAWELSTSLINFMALVTLVVSILIIIFAEPLVQYVVAPGLDESGRALAISMMRVVAINPFLFAIATVIASVQQAVGRFTFYALAPTLYNIGIIVGLLVFTKGINLFGWQVFDGGIMGLPLGVVFGSMLQLVVSSIGLIGLGFDYRFKIYWRNRGFRRVLSLLPARSLDQGMDYVVGIVETNLASRMASGSIRVYNQASILHMMPINLIGVAISTAAYPRMTERLAQNRPDLFARELRSIIRVILWIILPIGAATFFTRGYIVNFINDSGNDNVRMAGALGALVVAIIFRSLYHIAARSFYARQDTKTPLYVSVVAISLNIALAAWFSIALNMGVYGLAWAQSLVALIELLILFGLMHRQIKGLFTRSFFNGVTRMVTATAFMALVTYIFVQLLPLRSTDQLFFTTFPKFAAIIAASGITYLVASWLLEIREVYPVLSKLQRIFFGRSMGSS